MALIAAAAASPLGPALRDPGAALVGEAWHPDTLPLHWVFAWAGGALPEGPGPPGPGFGHAKMLAWPTGERPLLGGDGPHGMMARPLVGALGWPAAINLWAALLIGVNTLGGWAFGRALGGGAWAALVPAAALGFSPFVTEELSAGRFSSAAVGPLALALAAWARLSDPGAGAGRGALAGLGLALCAFSYWFAGWFAAVGAACLLPLGRPSPRAAVAAGALAAALLAPWAAVFAAGWAEIPGITEAAPPSGATAEEVLGWPLWAAAGAPPSARASLLPLPLLLAAALGLRAGRAAAAAAVLAGVGAALALGDQGPASPFPLLHSIADPLTRFWWPIRYVGLLQLGLGGLGALALRAAPPWAAVATAAAIPASLLLQGAQAGPAITPLDLQGGPWVELRDLPDGAILHLPLAPAACGANDHLIAQLVHQRPIVNPHSAWVERARPPGWAEAVRANTFLDALWTLEEGQHPTASPAFTGDDLEALRAAGLRYIALDRSMYAVSLTGLRQMEAGWLRELLGRPVLDIDGVQIFDLHAWTGETAAPVSPWRWPEGLPPAGPERPLLGPRPRSPILAGPAPAPDR